MIDFRYHLVSLVSVFMALAIGVVLGAGPLKGPIGDQLTNQVDGLLADKTALQQAVANRDERIAERDAFVEAVTPSLVTGQLGGTSVVLVTLPGTPSEGVEALTAELEVAGASVTGRVDLQERWVDPDQREFRKTLAGSQVQYVEPRPPASAGGEAELAAALARAILTDDVALAGEADADAETILGALAGGELVTVSGEPQRRATTVVVLAPADADAAGAGDADWVEATGTSGLTLLAALDAAGNGTVVAGPLLDSTAEGLVGRLRGDELGSDVSSVDSVDTPMGQVITALALREQLAGDAGHYGFGDGASAVVPDAPGGAPAAPSAGSDG